MFKPILFPTLASIILFCSSALASNSVTMQLVSPSGNDGKSIGTITLENTRYGLLILPQLQGLTPGLHGLHIHQNSSCADSGNGAGDHLDTQNTGKHAGPYLDNGHMGDLPVLYVNDKGEANTPTIAPKLTLRKALGHSMMIHEGGDNYSDKPDKMGGGGARLACGVISK